MSKYFVVQHLREYFHVSSLTFPNLEVKGPIEHARTTNLKNESQVAVMKHSWFTPTLCYARTMTVQIHSVDNTGTAEYIRKTPTRVTQKPGDEWMKLSAHSKYRYTKYQEGKVKTLHQ